MHWACGGEFEILSHAKRAILTAPRNINRTGQPKANCGSSIIFINVIESACYE
jgi:hypothetical protein